MLPLQFSAVFCKSVVSQQILIFPMVFKFRFCFSLLKKGKMQIYFAFHLSDFKTNLWSDVSHSHHVCDHEHCHPKHNDILLSSSSSWHVNYKDGGKISIAGGAQVETGGFGIWTKAVVSEPAVKKKPRPLYSPCGWVTEVLMYCEKILPPPFPPPTHHKGRATLKIYP